jgi:hypothetical protein
MAADRRPDDPVGEVEMRPTRVQRILATVLFVGSAVGMAASTTLAGPPAKPATDPCVGGLEPNLQPIVPHQLQIQNTGGREYLRLTNGLANTGQGPWHLEPQTVVSDGGGTTTAIQKIFSTKNGVSDPGSTVVCSIPTTVFEFHPAHNHWHIGSVARFGVHVATDDGTGGAIGAPVVNDRGISQSFKTTFCLIDWVAIDGQKKTPEVTYWACDRTAPYQGVSVGWIDQYHHSLEGQEIDLTGAPVGVYYLKVHANDDGVFVETDTSDNVAWRSFRLTRDSSGNPKITLIARSECSSPRMCGEDLPNR